MCRVISTSQLGAAVRSFLSEYGGEGIVSDVPTPDTYCEEDTEEQAATVEVVVNQERGMW